MGTQFGGRDITFLAGEDLSSYQYRFVHMADDNTVDLLDNGGEFPIGILQNAPASGEEAVVRVEGISKLVMNAAIAVGVQVKCEYVSASDNGKGDASDTEGDISRGVVVVASGAEDDVGAVLLIVNETSVPG